MEETGFECLIGNPGTDLRRDWTEWLGRASAAGELDPDDQLNAVRGWLRDAADRGELDEAGCLAAVDFDGSLLADVPYGMRTEDVCLDAVCGDWWALSAVPKETLSPPICGEAMASAVRQGLDMDSQEVLSLVPESMESDARDIAQERLAEEAGEDWNESPDLRP